MAKTLTLVLLGALIATLSGCVGAPSHDFSATPADVTGTWMGSTASGTRTMTLQLYQTGTNVTGTIKGGGLDGPTQAIIAGDNTIQFDQQGRVALRLRVLGDFMRGELDGVPLQLVRLGR